MNPTTTQAFSDLVARLLPMLAEYGGTEISQRTPEDDTLVRQLRVAAAAIAAPTEQVARLTPPAMLPPQPPPPRPADAP